MQKIFIALLFCSLAQPVVAQQKSPSFQDIEKQMQQFMEEFRKNAFGGSFFSMPGGDSSYTFRFDTTITGDDFFGSFHFGPFGSDSTMKNDPFGSDFFKQFFQGMDDPFRRDISPEEDAQGEPSEGARLLPEERMRQEEEKDGPENNHSRKSQPAEPAKPKIKTIRI